MTQVVECCGVPASGKSTVARLLGDIHPTLTPQATALTAVLRAREDGWFRKNLRRLPPHLWEWLAGIEHAQPELLDALAAYPEWMSRLFADLADWCRDETDRRMTLHACCRTLLIRRFLDTAHSGDRPVLMEEGLVHRAFTLYGYMPDKGVPEAQLRAWADWMPKPACVVHVKGDPAVLVQRIRARKTLGISQKLNLLTDGEISRTLEHGDRCLQVVLDQLHISHGVPVLTVSNQQETESLDATIRSLRIPGL